MAGTAVRGTEPATDFFVSYHPADSRWAQWIGNELEAAGYQVFLREWDLAPGSNLVIEIDGAMRQTQRTIAVLSQNYLDAETTAPQWTARFSEDPQGLRRQLVPVLIADVELSGSPFERIAPISLVGLGAAEALEALLAGVEGRRARRGAPPEFPGLTEGRAAAASPSVLWHPSDEPIRIRWRADNVHTRYNDCTVELHTIAVGGPDLNARALRALPTDLTLLGRQGGLFESSGAVYEEVDEERAEVKSLDRYASALGDRGIAVSRQCEVTLWMPLPHDYLGSVFDESYLTSRLAELLSLTARTGVISSSRVGVAVSLEPIASLEVGSVGDVGRRSSAQLLFTSAPADSLRMEATDTIPATALVQSSRDIAEELTSRIALRIKRISRF